MAAYVFGGYDAGTFADIRRQVRGGEFNGRAVLFCREDFHPADGSMRLHVRCEGMGYDVVYVCDASELAAYEQREGRE